MRSVQSSSVIAVMNWHLYTHIFFHPFLLFTQTIPVFSRGEKILYVPIYLYNIYIFYCIILLGFDFVFFFFVSDSDLFEKKKKLHLINHSETYYYYVLYIYIELHYRLYVL